MFLPVQRVELYDLAYYLLTLFIMGSAPHKLFRSKNVPITMQEGTLHFWYGAHCYKIRKILPNIMAVHLWWRHIMPQYPGYDEGVGWSCVSATMWNLTKIFIAPSFDPDEQNCFSVIMAADTQYPWTEPLWPGNTEAVSQQLIRDYFSSMAELREMWQNFCPIKAVIINGDLTAFGHHDELATFETLLEEARLKLGIPFYMGLGNHDYANNVDDCYDNNCAQRMVRYISHTLHYQNMHCGFQMARWAKQKFFDLCPPLKYRFRFNGSLAYSFDIENVTFIQLHNYPTYERTFEAHLKRDRLICPAYAKGRYVIESSLDFLEEKLIEACSQKKPIIVCFHDPSEHFKSNQRFINMIEKYNVAGVFVGHFHHMYGRYFQQRNGYGHVPLFGSGSAIYGDYLLVRFFTKRVVNVMKVLIYNAANGSAWRKPIWREDRIVYLL